MPGIVVFGRRWLAGSDDMVVPCLLLVCVHVIWLITLSVIFTHVEFDSSWKCSMDLRNLVLGYLVILSVCIVVEGILVWVSMRGGILDTEPRVSIQYLLYVRLVVFLGELSWLGVTIEWVILHYGNCSPDAARQSILGISVFNICLLLILIIMLWCTFDSAGRKWVKMKRYQESMKEKAQRSRRSGSARRNWRQRKAFRAYEESWDRRLGLMCCCVERKGRNKNSMSEIAQLFTEFFRDIDVVPSDVIAGLVLLRRYQKLRMHHTIQQGSNDVYRYLSGIPVTPRTQFVQLGQPEVLHQYQLVIHYMRFAMAAYGWPIFMMMNTGTGLCRLIPYFRCCCCRPCCSSTLDPESVLDDNCCECNLVALKKISGLPDTDLVYVTYHVDIGETPFFVALDHRNKKIVICVRGTLSLQDVLTDLKADAETLPVNPIREEWVGHKGMVQAAIYIKKKLKEDLILARAFEKCMESTGEVYSLVLVGHSLGAGTAAILAIMLQQEYPDLHCYAYSPPGGLLSYECMEETKSYITSVVVGKDVVPRIGLPQMELLRTDLINITKKSKNPKWKIIMKALFCGSESASKETFDDVHGDVERDVTAHPSDEQIGLTAHKPMFPPGKIILVVRNHPGGKRSCCGQREPVYQAIWADNSDFQEVLVSPTMVNDHMPDNVMDALEKVLVNVAPPKPTRHLSENERKALLNHDASSGTLDSPSSLRRFNCDHGVLLTQEQVIPTCEIICNSSRGNTLQSNHSGWDAATEEILLSLDREHLFPNQETLPRLELELGTDWIQAPLASPEIISAASSMVGLSSTNSFLKGETKVESAGPRLETIQQSPDMNLRPDSADGISYDDQCEIISETDVQIAGTPSTESIQDLFLKPNQKGDHLVTGSMNNLLRNPDLQSNAGLSIIDLQSDSVSRIVEGRNSSRNNSSVHLNLDALSAGPSNLDIPHITTEPVKSQNADHNHLQEPTDGFVYELHSPVETNQMGYGNLNDWYSAAGIGYSPTHISSVTSNAPPPSPSPSLNIKPVVKPIKRLHHSPSESYIEVLSDEYKMKRTKEEGDIANLGDTTKVFMGDKNKRMLFPTGSVASFDPSKLPKVKSGIPKLESLEEDVHIPDFHSKTNCIDDVTEQENNTENNKHDENTDSQDGKMKCQIGNNVCHTSDVHVDSGKQYATRKRLSIEDRVFDDETNHKLLNSSADSLDKDVVPDMAVSPTGGIRFDETAPYMYKSRSFHSASASSFSGESDKHLSSVSGQSDDVDLPIVETDV